MKDSDLHRQGAVLRRKLLGDKRMAELERGLPGPGDRRSSWSFPPS